MFGSAIFEHLQVKLDEDSQVREELRNIVQIMERQGVCPPYKFVTNLVSTKTLIDRTTMSILSRAHSIPQADRQL